MIKINISIKKKMIISNVLMIVIPIISFLLLVGIGLLIIDFERWDSIENVYENNKNTFTAQSIILSYKEILLKNPKQEKKIEIINKMDKRLTRLGYSFKMLYNDEILMSTLSNINQDRINNNIDEDNEYLFIENDKESFLVINFENKSNHYKIVAYTQNNTLNNNRLFSNIKISLIALITIVIVIMFIIVILTNLLLSSWITKTILRPLDMLKKGTRKIRNGDLEFEIDYKKTDEFGEVCDDFNKMKKQLQLSEESRNKYEEYRKEIINGVSHDLRTPLTSIKGYVEGLQDGIASTPEKKKRYYNAIHTRALDIEKMINSLSSLSSIENKEYKYKFERTEMNEYMKTTLDFYRQEFQSKNIKINFISKTNVHVNLDKVEFKRVFDNLFENTFKYGKKENPIIDISLIKKNNYIILTYKDNGKGVEEKELENIFLDFYRGDIARTKPENGSGLGLSITKRIIEGHKGTINARNNKGLELVMTIPIAKEK